MRSDARKKLAEKPATCDHPGVEHGTWSYTGICPQCGICKFIGHGPLCGDCYDAGALGAALILLDRTEQALRIVKADLDAQAVQLDEIRRVAAEWAEEDWPQVDDYLRGHAAGMRAAGGAILGRLG